MNTPGLNVGARRIAASHQAAAIVPASSNRTMGQADAAAKVGFSQLLQSRIAEVRFSAHAATRMKSRNIELTPEMIGKLSKAVEGAADKGARDSLILLKNYAFIVNIPDRTVVTAMDGNGLKENVFTNIDSAVVAD